MQIGILLHIFADTCAHQGFYRFVKIVEEYLIKLYGPAPRKNNCQSYNNL